MPLSYNVMKKSATLKVYEYKNCSSCKKALKWLSAHDLPYEAIPIRETPPSLKELKAMLGYLDGNIAKMFNTSGQDYRAMGLKDKLPDMSETEKLKLLNSNGNLVKRPFVLGENTGITGFKEELWEPLFL